MLRTFGKSRYNIGITNTGIFDLYTDYLLTSFSSTIATGLSEWLDGRISHDPVSPFLSKTKQPHFYVALCDCPIRVFKHQTKVQYVRTKEQALHQGDQTGFRGISTVQKCDCVTSVINQLTGSQLNLE